MKPLRPDDQILLPGVEPVAVDTIPDSGAPDWVKLAARMLARYRLACRGIAPPVSVELAAEFTRAANAMAPRMLAPQTASDARAAGLVGIAQSNDRAERSGPGFTARACERMRALLLERGPQTGETLVDLCKCEGFNPPDDRAFGAVFLKLKRYADVVGTAPRRKGHGTSGARVWKARESST